MSPFPDIDLTPLSGPTVGRLAAACREHGFFLASGHGVSAELIADVDRVTREFFAQPLIRKQAVGARTAAGWLGYRGVGSMTTAATIDREAPSDLVETFGIKSVDAANPFSAANVWPSAPVGFREVWSWYSQEMVRLQTRLLRVFELALELPPGWFDDKFDRHFSGLKANYYPAQATEPLPGQLRRGPHTDYGFMTLLYQDDAPGGLQVETAPGVWADVPHVPGTFVVNIADLLSRWTNGRWISSMHRVVNPPRRFATADRLSLPFFVNPNADAVIACLPGCADGSEGDPVIAGPWIDAKVALANSPTTGASL